MREKIAQICKNLEKQYKIKILFAVENGSRVWRMESKDSDYDVRFVFHYPLKEYIQINKPKEVIEAYFDHKAKPLSSSKGALIDAVGFDLFKFTKLLSSSNPATIEWLLSDIVYYGRQNPVFHNFAKNKFNPLSLYHHYKSMCKYNYSTYVLSGKNITYKKYLYTFRGIVNAKWIVCKKSIPPLSFPKTIEELGDNLPQAISKEIQRIIGLKSPGREENIIPKISILDYYIEEFLSHDEEAPLPNKTNNLSQLNNEIIKILMEK